MGHGGHRAWSGGQVLVVQHERVDTPGDQSEAIEGDPALTAVSMRAVPTRDLIAALAATEDGLRDGVTGPDVRRALVGRQARIVRELRRRRTRWRQG